MKRKSEGFRQKYNNNITRLEVALHLTRTGWTSPIKCNMSWFENLVIQMKLYNYYDVPHNFIKVKKVFNLFSIYFVCLLCLIIYYTINFILLKYTFAITLLLLGISKKEC